MLAERYFYFHLYFQIGSFYFNPFHIPMTLKKKLNFSCRLKHFVFDMILLLLFVYVYCIYNNIN